VLNLSAFLKTTFAAYVGRADKDELCTKRKLWRPTSKE